MIIKNKNKRGLSTVVEVVLLIVITIAAVAVIAGVIIPLVKNSLKSGQSCLELNGYVTIVDNGYTCTNSSGTYITIEREMKEYKIQGFIVSLIKAGSSTKYEIKNATASEGVTMLDTTITTLVLPRAGETRTYHFASGDSSTAELGVISEKGEICAQSGSFEIRAC